MIYGVWSIIMGLLGEFSIYFVSLCWLKAARAKHEDSS